MFITQMNPAIQVGGTSVVLNNLISNLDPCIHTICYLNYFKIFNPREEVYKNSIRLIPNYSFIQIAGIFSDQIRVEYAIRKAIKIVKGQNVKFIVGIYPTFKSIKIAYEVSRRCNIKFIPYLNDLLYESLSHTFLKDEAKKIEKNVFTHSYKILTMSQGMSNYYNKKFNIKTFPLEHSYPEKIEKKINTNRTDIVFWGGSIQPFNSKGFNRILGVTTSINKNMEVTNLQSEAGMGINVGLINNFYPKREDYLIALIQKGVLTLAIDWSDESPINSEELATIFPTRVIEYFASGSPILVHCPEDYFLAKFFKEHHCGMVVSERNESQLLDAIKFLLSGSKEVRDMQNNALKVAQHFSMERITGLFQAYLNN